MGIQRREPSVDRLEGKVRPEYRLPTPVIAKPKKRRRPWPWIVASVALLSTWVAYEVHRSLVPHLGRATEAEILAAIPPDLAAPEPEDPDAEARFVRLSRLLHEGFEREDAAWSAYERARKERIGVASKVRPPEYTQAERDDYERRCLALIPKVQALVAEGPIRPTHADGERGIRHWWRALLPRHRVLAAARRSEYETCVEDALWRLCLVRCVAQAGTSLDDNPSPGSAEMRDDVETIYQVEMAGGYGPQGRARVLAALVPFDWDRLLQQRIRRYFQGVLIPQVVRVARGEDYWKVRDLNELPELMGGTFDPIETAKLMAAGIGASLADLDAPRGKRNKLHAFSAEARKRFEGGPPKASPLDRGTFLRNLEWRVAMNRCANSLGADWATSVMPALEPPYYDIRPGNAVALALVRSVLLLHHGRTDLPRDLYGVGPIRFDPKRRLVWSVGVDGINGEARFVERFGSPNGPPPDVVYRY